jgi:subtilisin family serine protease
METTLDALQTDTLVDEKISLKKLLSDIKGIALHDVAAKAKGSHEDDDFEDEDEEDDDFDDDFDDDDFDEEEVADWDEIEEVDPDDLKDDDDDDDDLFSNEDDEDDEDGWDDNF